MGRISYNDKTDVIDNIIQLKKEFTRYSGGQPFEHKQVYHNNGWYIYKITAYNYEVFKENVVQCVDYIDNKITPSNRYKVKYPDDEDFGFWAWSVNSFDRALQYVNNER